MTTTSTATCQCGGKGFFVKENNSFSPHYGSYRCNSCGCFLEWVPSPATVKRREVRHKLISQLLQCKGLTDWEKRFLNSVATQKKLSPKQLTALGKIAIRMEVGK